MLKRESDEKNLLDKRGQVVQSLDRVHVGQQQVPVQYMLKRESDERRPAGPGRAGSTEPG
jgi:hypothetical protein